MHNIRYCVVIVIFAITSFHSLNTWTASPILERAVWNYWIKEFVVSDLLMCGQGYEVGLLNNFYDRSVNLCFQVSAVDPASYWLEHQVLKALLYLLSKTIAQCFQIPLQCYRPTSLGSRFSHPTKCFFYQFLAKHKGKISLNIRSSFSWGCVCVCMLM